ncbi:oxygenase MpaB family protein [Mycobacterium talmoniae]|uniref:oxygenase MpaB family protein n=1 Tax=Mycobacterium talmoniae TaxID=1858794 RepID=UPI000A681182|nr:oxygenase MpaB family protein [Mycobacterium talmoniae]
MTVIAPGGHPYDYYYRPGMPLRPPPPRLQPDPAWADLPVFDDFRPAAPTRRQRDLLELFIDHYWQGDALMDAVVERFRVIGVAHGRRLLDQALARGIDSLDDPPPELVDLFASLDNPPEWHDAKEWERGRRLWVDCSLAGKVGMVIQDAIGTFVGAEVSSATGATKRFVNAPLVRNVETAKWFHDATKPGFLDRYGPEFRETVRVRLMHSQVRQGLRRSWGDEHFGYHGNPISTSLTMGAAVTFGLLPMLTDHNHGRKRHTAELDLVMRYWSYIAYVFGVAPEIIPTTAADGIMLADYATATAGGPTDWTAQMTRAASDNLATIAGVPGMLARAAVSPLVGAVAYYSGDPLARALVSATPYRDVPIQPWKTLTGLAVHACVKSRMVLDRVPGAGLRRAVRAARGDPWESLAVRAAELAARRRGITGTPYRHHDDTPNTPVGCPVRAPS